MTANARTDRVQVRVNLRVVGGFVAGEVSPGSKATRDKHERSEEQQEPGSPAPPSSSRPRFFDDLPGFDLIGCCRIRLGVVRQRRVQVLGHRWYQGSLVRTDTETEQPRTVATNGSSRLGGRVLVWSGADELRQSQSAAINAQPVVG